MLFIVLSVLSGDGSLSKNSMTLVGRDPVSSVSEEVNASTQTASLQELRSTEESSTSPESCNVPCEQTPTKTNVVVVVADESTPKSSFVTCTTIDTDVPFNSSLTSSPSSHLQRESCSYPFSPDVESVEDVELRKIEESAKVLRNLLPCGSSGAYTPKTHRRLFLSSDGTLRNSPSPSLSCQSLSSRCSTPDLPLPPPPKTTDVDLLANDEPLPPPPSISEMTHALAEPQVSNKFSPPATPEDSHISG